MEVPCRCRHAKPPRFELCSISCLCCVQIVVERAKWKDCWDEVRFCSDRCKAEAKKMKRQQQQAEQAARNDGDGAMQPCQAPP